MSAKMMAMEFKMMTNALTMDDLADCSRFERASRRAALAGEQAEVLAQLELGRTIEVSLSTLEAILAIEGADEALMVFDL